MCIRDSDDSNQAVIKTAEGLVNSNDQVQALPLKTIDTNLNPSGVYTNTGTSSINPFQV